jgi:hypothetical protein
MSSGGLDFPALSSAPSPSRKEQQQRKAAAADVVPAAAAASASHSPKTPTKRQQQQQQHQQHHHPHSPQRHAPAAGGSPRTPDRRALSHSNSSSNSHGSAASHSSSGAAKARPAASPHKTSGGAQLDDFDQFFVGTASLIHDIDSATKGDAPREPAPDLPPVLPPAERVLVVLREPGVPTGTKYFGVLRSFDQFCEWAVCGVCACVSRGR